MLTLFYTLGLGVVVLHVIVGGIVVEPEQEP
jgi:hypothetical protein